MTTGSGRRRTLPTKHLERNCLMRIANRTLVPAVLAAALLCPLAVRQAQAQPGPRPPIAGVQVVVRDLATQQDIGTVEPGGTISVPAGSQVRLIMNAIPDLQVGTTKGYNRNQAVGYQIRDDWVPASLRSGTIYLQVVPATAAPESVGSSLTGSSRAQDLTRMLYQAILMRDPDPAAQGTVDAIARGGYDALVQAAVGIANSDESRNRLQGVSSEDRLNSLYQNLLGLSPDQVDRQQYNSDLRRVNQGRIADVVSGMVQSDRFRSRANVASTRY